MRGFKLDCVSGSARTGWLLTPHGKIETPFFMPVATKGSVKLLSNEEVESTKTECMISNAFVLSLRPGLGVIEKHGGLHKFMNWKKGLFTDSGGFQVLSKEFCIGLSDEGVLFRNPFDGTKSLFTPQKAIEIQNKLGADVAMCLDDVPLHGVDGKRLKEAVERTTLWARQCKESHENKKQLLFGITQGGTNQKLREKSAKEIAGIGFDGIAVGGLCIGEEKNKMFVAVKESVKLIPQNTPRYLMGVGSAQELIKAVGLGVDVFDSCFPTRTARHGLAFSSQGNLNINNARFRIDLAPLDSDCACFVCQNHTRAYVHHLVKTKEENGLKYLSYHNVFFIQKLLKKIRQSIKENEAKAFASITADILQ